MTLFKNIFSFEGSNFNLFLSKRNKDKNKKFDKNTAAILFIDDEEFPIVKNLHKQAGWNTKRISDLKNLQDPQIIQSQIIFVDYEGVGGILYPKEKGLGIVKALKETYGDSKRVILYSGHNTFPVDAKLEVADDRLAKNSDLYEFIRVIEAEIKNLNI
jgi:hypothetical protein